MINRITANQRRKPEIRKGKLRYELLVPRLNINSNVIEFIFLVPKLVLLIDLPLHRLDSELILRDLEELKPDSPQHIRQRFPRRNVRNTPKWIHTIFNLSNSVCSTRINNVTKINLLLLLLTMISEVLMVFKNPRIQSHISSRWCRVPNSIQIMMKLVRKPTVRKMHKNKITIILR